MDLPAPVVGRAGGHDLGGLAEEVAGGGRVHAAQQRAEPVPPGGGLLVALLVCQGAHPGGQGGHHVGGVVAQGAACALDDGGVLVGRDCTHTRRRASAEVRQDAGGGLGPAGKGLGARTQRQGLRQRLRGCLGRAPARVRADVARPTADVVADRAHHADPWEPLNCELEPDGVLRPRGPPVVARGPGGDRAQLAHLGLQRGGARDRDHLGGQADHLGHPAALFGGCEVAEHPSADRAGRAHVERRSLGVLEHVDPGTLRQAIGEAALAAASIGDPAAVPLQLGEGVHPEVADTLHQPVQDVHGCLRIGQGAVVGRHLGAEVPGERAEFAVGDLVAGQDVAGQARGVQDRRVGPVHRQLRAGALEEAHVVGRVVGHEHRTVGELEERRQDGRQGWCPAEHVVGDPRQGPDERGQRPAEVDQGLELPDHLPAAHLDGPDLGDPGAGRAAAVGLQVDHDEGDLGQPRAEVVEGQLGGRAHGPHRRCEVRHRRGSHAGAGRLSGLPPGSSTHLPGTPRSRSYA